MQDRIPSRHNPTYSPLEPVFATYGDAVPFALREQFLVSPEDPFDVVLWGKMHAVGYRPRWLWPLMWALGRMGILVPANGRNVPMTLRVLARRDRKGRPYHTWVRTFYFPGRRPVRFNTTIIYDPGIDRTADLVGHKKSIFVVWKARFRPPVTFTLDTDTVALRFGRRRLWLPRLVWRWMFGVVHHSQWTDPQHEDTLHIELMLWHPLIGYYFSYYGVFRLTRDYERNQESEVRSQKSASQIARLPASADL